MMKWLICGSTVAWITCVVLCQAAGLPPGSDAEALQALVLVKQLITRDNFKDYGLDSFDQVQTLKLESGVDTYYVYTNSLKAFGNGKKAGSALTASQTKLYPVSSNGQGVFIITLRFREGKWKIASFGQSDQARELALMVRTERLLPGRESGVYAIEIPSLNLAYGSFALPTPKSDLMLVALSSESFKVANSGLIRPEGGAFAYIGSPPIDGGNLFRKLSNQVQKLGDWPETPH
jgi:hypothetical protein